ncbi:tuberoinfundibular peptide of 39 residues [Carettochelys insculpta]|uniref:tuberoinfundibular peptide of 39 residues n=1 Tax=Carettochelys insculpta TaxID=44489 RepID=UPI003EC06E56
MDTTPGATRALGPLTFLLGCTLLLCSGARLPSSYPPYRLGTRNALQAPSESGPAWDHQKLPLPLWDWSLGALAREGQSRKSHLWSGTRQEVPAGWGGKRNIVVADDAAFRERSKLLTAMERQKWLNAYMQKLLVVNPD